MADLPAEQHLVPGGGAAVGAALDPDEADVGDVVLTARVRAAGDVDAHPADIREAGALERRADVVGETSRLRDGEVARVGARARHDVAGELGARLRHPDRAETRVQVGELVLAQPSEREVLPVRDAHLEAELALDLGQLTELV